MKTQEEYIKEINDKRDKAIANITVLLSIKDKIESLGFNYDAQVDSDYSKLWFNLYVDSFYEVLPILEAVENVTGKGCGFSYDADDALYRAYSFWNIVVFAHPKPTSSCEVIDVPTTIKAFKCA